MPLKVVAYVTAWCPDCTRSRRVLERAGVDFREIDIESVAGGEDEMRAINGGSGRVPTIIVSSEVETEVLVEPSDRELTAALECLARNGG